jgi:hypothetical protein
VRGLRRCHNRFEAGEHGEPNGVRIQVVKKESEADHRALVYFILADDADESETGVRVAGRVMTESRSHVHC